MAISAVVTGTIFAQDDDTNPTAWLGVRVSETDEGVVISRVKSGSPAEAAGLLADDVIVSVDGEAIDSADALSAGGPGSRAGRCDRGGGHA